MVLAFLLTLLPQQQSPDEWFLRWPAPTSIDARRVERSPVIDGRLNESAWTTAVWSAPFVDITGDPSRAPWFATRMAVVWDDSALYIAANMVEPGVWATLRKRDTVIFLNNDFEIFIDPDGDNHMYAEIEVNAFNTVWDLLLERPYRDGGPARTDWTAEGMRTAIHVNGTLNDPSDRDSGWSVEVALPWKVFRALTSVTLPPSPGDSWRMNFSRVQWPVEVVDGTYRKPAKGEENWVWSPQGIVNMHVPERWGSVRFVEEGMEAKGIDVSEENARRAVMEVYHAQKQFFRAHKRWAYDPRELNAMLSRPLNAFVTIEISEEGFVAVLPMSSGRNAEAITVRQDSKIKHLGTTPD